MRNVALAVMEDRELGFVTGSDMQDRSVAFLFHPPISPLSFSFGQIHGTEP